MTSERHKNLNLPFFPLVKRPLKKWILLFHTYHFKFGGFLENVLKKYLQSLQPSIQWYVSAVAMHGRVWS